MQPNIQVVLRSLPERAEEPDIDKHLKSMGASIEQVNLIRDRDTGESRKFAFVRFTSVGHAVEFMDKYYPYFFMGHQRVRLDYSRKEGNREDAVEWRCSNCGKFNEDSRRACVECRTPFESKSSQKETHLWDDTLHDGWYFL
ncbi:uncharacterized protein BYT42DRAFT_502033 [Radiomyces spectabilis]|uniref:uncharacterized protein n=1 Tax=Radiomyces spectabilis TaxID=64574 RepID=UPI0022211976|nr:uncharacterized protein BYT42DRAFT_502033 [Radiomyces spectabilis]KAI8370619.1 hypothetical protein BYT42DRAFT_502033 [Radiomyces spectabilis]